MASSRQNLIYPNFFDDDEDVTTAPLQARKIAVARDNARLFVGNVINNHSTSLNRDVVSMDGTSIATTIMMDPLAFTETVLAAVTRAATTLRLCQRHAAHLRIADLSVASLHTDCSTIRLRLNDIKKSAFHEGADLLVERFEGYILEEYDNLLQACCLPFSILNKHLDELGLNQAQDMDRGVLKTNLQGIWAYPQMELICQNIRGLARAIDILGSAFRSGAVIEASEIMRDPEAKRILASISGDAASLHESFFTAREGQYDSIRESVMGDEVFGFDDVLRNTELYRRASMRQMSISLRQGLPIVETTRKLQSLQASAAVDTSDDILVDDTTLKSLEIGEEGEILGPDGKSPPGQMIESDLEDTSKRILDEEGEIRDSDKDSSKRANLVSEDAKKGSWSNQKAKVNGPKSVDGGDIPGPSSITAGKSYKDDKAEVDDENGDIVWQAQLMAALDTQSSLFPTPSASKIKPLFPIRVETTLHTVQPVEAEQHERRNSADSLVSEGTVRALGATPLVPVVKRDIYTNQQADAKQHKRRDSVASMDTVINEFDAASWASLMDASSSSISRFLRSEPTITLDSLVSDLELHQEPLANQGLAKGSRLPTLFEVLSRQTVKPYDLFDFYLYMRDIQRSVDYLDFWLDVSQHMSLCRHYVRELGRAGNKDMLNARGLHVVERSDVRASAEKILYTFLLPGAEREIIVPLEIHTKVVSDIEEDGRDDPEVFEAAKDYVFQAMERDAFPGFLSLRKSIFRPFRNSKSLGPLVLRMMEKNAKNYKTHPNIARIPPELFLGSLGNGDIHKAGAQ